MDIVLFIADSHSSFKYLHYIQDVFPLKCIIDFAERNLAERSLAEHTHRTTASPGESGYSTVL